MVLCSVSLLTAFHGYLPHLSSNLKSIRIASSHKQRWSNSLALSNCPFLLNLNGKNIHIRNEILKIIEIKGLKVQADDQIGCSGSI